MRALLAGAIVITASFGRADGQSGTIVYASGTSLDVELPREMAEVRDVLEAMSRRSYLLHFTPTQSLMVRGEGRERFSPARFRATDASLDALGQLLDAWLTAEPNVLVRTYSGEGGSSGVRVLSALNGELFRAPASVSPVEWRITEEQREHLGYEVTRAVGEIGGRIG